MSTFKWEATGTHWLVDQIHQMMLRESPPWNPDDYGEGDSIGRSFMAYVTYGDPRFMEGIENCWQRVDRKGIKKFLFGKYYYQGYRYPVRLENENGLSRDHLTYTIIAFKYAGYSDEFIKDFVKHLRYKISEFAWFRPDLWLWTRAIANIKPYTTLFYPIQWLALAGSLVWNRALYKYTGFGPEVSQDDFILVANSFKPSRIKKLAKLFYPTFALHITSWQIKLMPDSKWKKRLQKLALKLCPEHNYVIQLLNNHPELPTQEQVDNYKSMTGGRWTSILNTWLNSRDLKKIKDPSKIAYNALDEDYLRKLYYTITCSDI